MGVLYNLIFKRTSTYVVGIMASVFFFERAFDLGSEAVFNNVNKGVSSECLCNIQDLIFCLFTISEIVEGHRPQIRSRRVEMYRGFTD